MEFPMKCSQHYIKIYFSNLSSHKNTTLQDWVHFLIKISNKTVSKAFSRKLQYVIIVKLKQKKL